MLEHRRQISVDIDNLREQSGSRVSLRAFDCERGDQYSPRKVLTGSCPMPRIQVDEALDDLTSGVSDSDCDSKDDEEVKSDQKQGQFKTK